MSANAVLQRQSAFQSIDQTLLHDSPEGKILSSMMSCFSNANSLNCINQLLSDRGPRSSDWHSPVWEPCGSLAALFKRGLRCLSFASLGRLRLHRRVLRAAWPQSCSSRATKSATSSTIWTGTGGTMLYQSISLLLTMSEAQIIGVDAFAAQPRHPSKVRNVQSAPARIVLASGTTSSGGGWNRLE